MDTERWKKTRSTGALPISKQKPGASRGLEASRTSLPTKFMQQQKPGRSSSSSAESRNLTSEDGPEASPAPVWAGTDRSAIPSKYPSCQPQASDGGIGDTCEVTIAVLGRSGVGKSTFMQCALDLKKPGTSPISSKKVSLEGSISIVRLVELNVEDIGISENRISWPETTKGLAIPAIDGVLLLYNVVDRSSIENISEVLGVLHSHHISTILIAARCDTSPKHWRVTPKMIDGIRLKFNGVDSFQTALTTPETHKRCISIMLRNIMLARHGDICELNNFGRIRAATSSQPTSPSKPKHISGSQINHRRAASEAPGNLPQTPLEPSARKIDDISPPRTTSRFQNRRASIRSNHDRYISSSSSTLLDDFDEERRVRPHSPQRLESRELPTRHPIMRFDSIEITEDEMSTDTVDLLTDDQNKKRLIALAPIERPKTGDDDETGVPFGDLVDRLLISPRSKNDSKFVVIFLCLYRKFASPSELLVGIIQRFEDLTHTEIPDLVKLTEQLRYLNVLEDWISDYPGDFAHPATRRLITTFVQTLAIYPEFAVAHKEISPYLDILGDDDDTEWAVSDQRRSRASTMESYLTTSSTQSATSTVTADSSTEDILDPTNSEKPIDSESAQISKTPSLDLALEQSGNQSTGYLQVILNKVEDARHQAQLLSPVPRHALDKLRWHQLVDTSEEDIALELTRIDWILYSSIRPRDLIRHISLEIDLKEKCKSLEYVNRMINEFNHVAFWVANMILLREKPKHRAMMLEKFMGVAWKLRYLNNYNSLGAIIAGINGTAVHRLTQTRDLVSPEARKQFMRLEILMGTAKSHSAYRLGWQNTSSPRIPFLPLHRRDLVFAEEGNRTFVGDDEGHRINWRKFEIMGEVIVEIRRSQGLPYPTIKKNEEVQRLVLDGRFSKDEDELYERSIQLEGQGVGETIRKKFNWFQR